MADILISHRKGSVLFESFTPKGEEFLQIYLTKNTLDDEKLVVVYKLQAERLGLVVADSR